MDLVVNKFVTSHAMVHPLLVIGYEMFRSYSEAFNSINSLELLICDEGHRLKNCMGTKTSVALSNCCAMKRIVLTGTPVQNNLEELFSVVQFVTPGYLGTVQEFQALYSKPIADANTRGSSSEVKSLVCTICLSESVQSIEMDYVIMSLFVLGRTSNEVATRETLSYNYATISSICDAIGIATSQRFSYIL
jgi:SNF2 family DNA or RNA helicase